MSTSLYSALDSARFGFRVGKAYPLVLAGLPAALEQSREENLKLLLARCAIEDLATVHALEAAGFRLMDTLVHLARPLGEADEAETPGVRVAAAADVAAVAAIARRAFADYVGHYHADQRLPRQTVAEIYPDWASRAISVAGVADRVLVAELDGEVAGFAVLKRLDDARCDGVLYGVDPAKRRRGVYRALLSASLAWGRAAGFATMEYSTQLSNLTALRTVGRLGFLPERSFHTFHRWFD